jgi:ABC-2 type transport system permease protein
VSATATAAPAPAHGPVAFGGDVRRLVNLTVVLATTDFKLRYRGSILGYLWSLMRPLLFFGILYVVFTRVLRFGGSIAHYPVYLLTAIVLWTYFLETTNGCVSSLVAREALLRKIRFPRLVIPLTVALTALFNLALNLVVVIVFALASGIDPRWTWLELPLVLVPLLLALSTGIGMLLSALYVRYRDIQPIWEIASQVLFYASPVLYVASFYKSWQHVAMANPIGALLTQMRRAFVDPHAPSAAATIGGAPLLAIPLAIIAAVFALGLFVFRREAPRIAENL